MADTYCVISTTTESLQEAENMARMLVSRRLAACVQIADVSSIYTWQGEIRKEPEHLLLIKAPADKYVEIEALIRENHTDVVPEILQTPVAGGWSGYLDWISESTR